MIVPSFLVLLGGVILVDLILSGDNALIIGAVAAPIMPRRRRLIVLAFGGLLAIFLRITFTISATFLLDIPYIQAIGGIVIALIAFRLVLGLFPEKSKTTNQDTEELQETNAISGPLPPAAQRLSNWTGKKMERRFSPNRWQFLMAVLTITIADITMSLDNIIAIGALAHGQALVLVIGLSLSIVLLLVSSAFVAELMNRFPRLILVASFILGWVAGDLIWNNLDGLPFFQNNQNALLYHIGLSLLMIFLIHTSAAVSVAWQKRRTRTQASDRTSASSTITSNTPNSFEQSTTFVPDPHSR